MHPVGVREPLPHLVWLSLFGVVCLPWPAANVIDTTCEILSVPAKWPKFLGTTPVNMALVRGATVSVPPARPLFCYVRIGLVCAAVGR